MFILSAAILIGSRMPPRLTNRPNLYFVAVWLVVFVLVFLLVAIAMIDWFSTRIYARRHRTAIVREAIEILRDELKVRRLSSANGRVLDDADPMST